MNRSNLKVRVQSKIKIRSYKIKKIQAKIRSIKKCKMVHKMHKIFKILKVNRHLNAIKVDYLTHHVNPCNHPIQYWVMGIFWENWKNNIKMTRWKLILATTGRMMSTGICQKMYEKRLIWQSWRAKTLNSITNLICSMKRSTSLHQYFIQRCRTFKSSFTWRRNRILKKNLCKS